MTIWPIQFIRKARSHAQWGPPAFGGPAKSTILFAGYCLVCISFILLNTLLMWVMVKKMAMNDFGKFWFSSLAFLNNQDMYGNSPATLIEMSNIYAQQFWNLNPPHFHILIIPLAFLPPLISLAVWGIASLAALILTLHLIGAQTNIGTSRWRSRMFFLGLLAFAGTGATFVTGQLSFLLLLPVTLAWIKARNRQWEKAGFILGITASVKPFLLIFLPYFLLRKQWKVAVITILSSVTPFIIGLPIFGYDNYRSWLHQLASVDWTWAAMNASFLGVLTRTFSENPLYAVFAHFEALPVLLWFLLVVIAGGTTFFLIHHDHSSLCVDRAFFLLLLLAILCSPLGWIYYLFLPLGPATSLVSSWWIKQSKELSSRTMSLMRMRHTLFLVALPGYFIPVQLTISFQPNYFLTPSLGSPYFWSTLVLWIALLVDCRVANPNVPNFQTHGFRPDTRHSVAYTSTNRNDFPDMISPTRRSRIAKYSRSLLRLNTIQS